MRLLTKEIRKKLPLLGSQDKLGGEAVAHVKFFTPDSSWTWYATEASAVVTDGDTTEEIPLKDVDPHLEEVDVIFFGLVDGFEKEFGYFSLSELQAARGPLGLAIERDLYWQPKTLKEIAPELFTPVKPPR